MFNVFVRAKEMKKTIIISVVFLFLAGCNGYEVKTHGVLKYMSLDDAIAQASSPYTYDVIIYPDRVPYLYDLGLLRKQAKSEKDKAIIDRMMAEYRLRKTVWVQQQREEREERERLEHERLDRERKRERFEFEKKRKELIQNSDGTLRNKSVQQVKKLFDRWKEGSWQWQWQDWAKDISKFFSVETFYKVFGEPDKKQYFSSVSGYGSDSYYFLYICKDGIVVIEVNSDQLDDNGIVIIEDLNIF